MGPARVRPTTFNDAWFEATERGELRRSIWDPPSRKIAGPQHAFRAGFQAFLSSQRVPEEVIDGLGPAEGGEGTVVSLEVGRRRRRKG